MQSILVRISRPHHCRDMNLSALVAEYPVKDWPMSTDTRLIGVMCKREGDCVACRRPRPKLASTSRRMHDSDQVTVPARRAIHQSASQRRGFYLVFRKRGNKELEGAQRGSTSQ
jgi:hypothetical protein